MVAPCGERPVQLGPKSIDELINGSGNLEISRGVQAGLATPKTLIPNPGLALVSEIFSSRPIPLSSVVLLRVSAFGHARGAM